jgi:hypothetical protein
VRAGIGEKAERKPVAFEQLHPAVGPHHGGARRYFTTICWECAPTLPQKKTGQCHQVFIFDTHIWIWPAGF